jgi:membrane protease YdiL (CAAX protease family)
MVVQKALRIIVSVVLGILVLALSNVVAFVVPEGWAQTAVQLSMLILSLGAILVLSRGHLAEYGFQSPRYVRWVRLCLAALVVGVGSTLVTVLAGAGEHPLEEETSFLQIVWQVWLLASVSEEVLARGLVQGFLATLNEDRVQAAGVQIRVPALVSALFFAAMHLMLLAQGAGGAFVTIAVVSALLVGLLAGHSRAESGSLLPAVVVHALANVGGVMGGMVIGMVTMAVTGEPPA